MAPPSKPGMNGKCTSNHSSILEQYLGQGLQLLMPTKQSSEELNTRADEAIKKRGIEKSLHDCA
eukprot:5736286-Amphidinium_carterae.1